MRIPSIAGEADNGMTMVEVVVSMTVMSIVMSIFTTGVLQVYRTMNKTESLSTAQAQVLTAFQRMDREVRYASAISDPAAIGSDYYVEYLMAGGGAGTCVELRLQGSPQRLLRRQWANGSPPSTGKWAVLASSVTAGTPKPFVFAAADADSNLNFQQLRVNLVVTAGAGSTATVRESRVSFAALNSPIDPAARNNAICTDGRLIA